mmetsp:Transcript_6931/g.23029  ORF Transcript_6931/g.23029 Transcript_6931/m.23029 type:complete len:361 (-) Transcript_6931:67-1149(-)
MGRGAGKGRASTFLSSVRALTGFRKGIKCHVELDLKHLANVLPGTNRLVVLWKKSNTVITSKEISVDDFERARIGQTMSMDVTLFVDPAGTFFRKETTLVLMEVLGEPLKNRVYAELPLNINSYVPYPPTSTTVVHDELLPLIANNNEMLTTIKFQLRATVVSGLEGASPPRAVPGPSFKASESPTRYMGPSSQSAPELEGRQIESETQEHEPAPKPSVRVVCGQLTRMKIRATDEFGNARSHGGDEVEIRMQGPFSNARHSPVSVTDRQDGSYSVEFTMHDEGMWELVVVINGHGRPETVNVLAVLADHPFVSRGLLKSAMCRMPRFDGAFVAKRLGTRARRKRAQALAKLAEKEQDQK